MAAKQPAVGIDHVTVVPTNADVNDGTTTEPDGGDDAETAHDGA